MTAANRNDRGTWVPFAYGFRSFFLLAGLYAMASIGARLWTYGHGGSPLRVYGSISVAYALLALSEIVRALGPSIPPFGYVAVVMIAGTLWIAAFIPYLAVYGPILLEPRADGKPG